MAKKQNKRHSISSKIIVWTAVTITILLVIMGVCLYYRISGIDEAQYSKLTKKNLSLTDAAINQYFHGVEKSGQPLIMNKIAILPGSITAMDGFTDFKSFLNGVLSSDDSEVHEFVLVVDKTGTILINKMDTYTEFKNISSLGIPGLENYSLGEKLWFRTSIAGTKYEIRSFPSGNLYVPMDYIYIIPLEIVDAADNSIYITLAAALILGILLSIIIMKIVSGTIIKPLLNVAKILKDISEGEGDLTQRLPVAGNDEVTDIATFFNQTMEKIDSTMKTVQSESGLMKNAAGILSNNMTETASALNQITSNINSIKGQVTNQTEIVEKNNEVVSEIGSNIDNLNGSIERQVQSVSQSTSAVEEMVANIRSVTEILTKNEIAVKKLTDSADNGREIVQKTADSIKKISEESEGLMEATEIIQNIAEQTNLLAMNAAIEAAHAGEAGKGFAVVSDEIRKLAEDSNEQSRKISDVLGGLKELIATVSKDSQEIQKQFQIIFENTQDVKNQEAVIKTAMDEQSEGGQQILDAMQQINSITDEVKEGAKLMSEGGEKVQAEMKNLASVTLEISGSMNEMSTGVNDINNSMQNINEQSRQNMNSIENVTDEINKFKV
jgi:methyl-accepting chemotaxis protein